MCVQRYYILIVNLDCQCLGNAIESVWTFIVRTSSPNMAASFKCRNRGQLKMELYHNFNFWWVRRQQRKREGYNYNLTIWDVIYLTIWLNDRFETALAFNCTNLCISAKNLNKICELLPKFYRLDKCIGYNVHPSSSYPPTLQPLGVEINCCSHRVHFKMPVSYPY